MLIDKQNHKSSLSRVSVFVASAITVSFCALLMISTGIHAAVFPDINIEQYQDLEWLSEVSKPATKADDCCAKPSFDMPKGIAKVEQQILFSRQDGSWMFQSLVNNGLFEIAAGYQPQHPRALLIKSGSLTLDQLYTRVANKAILAKKEVGYQLFYPIIIEPSAALIIDNPLELTSEAGVAIINRGQLYIRNGSVSASVDISNRFRSFILSWNGSYTSIIDSQLKNLGYDDFLSKGLTLTAHEQSQASKPGVLMVESSVFEGAFVGVRSNAGNVLLTNNEFKHSRSEAIDLRNSSVQVLKNKVQGTKTGHGIRLISNRSQVVTKNSVSGSAKSGLVISDTPVLNEITGNKLQENGENGLWIDLIKPKNAETLIIKGNIAANNQLSGIKTNCIELCLFQSNLLIGNKSYGFTLENPSVHTHHLILQKNYFKLNGLASVQASGFDELTLSDNKFYFDAIQSKVFVGDLEPYQSLIQKSLSEQNQGIRIKKEMIQ
ncbi:right-handed parallel beta-helix repeat-containing protein [Litoribrevibacter euphylliae]